MEAAKYAQKSRRILEQLKNYVQHFGPIFTLHGTVDQLDIQIIKTLYVFGILITPTNILTYVSIH